MSLEAESKKKIQEIKAGVHLVTISGMKRHLDQAGNSITKNGEVALLVTFETGEAPILRHEQVYWVGKGNEGLERHFTSMCIDAGVDMSKTPLSRKDVVGKRLWVAIREIYTLISDGTATLKSEVTGKDVIEYFIFRTGHIHDETKPPSWLGDPIKNNGIAMDDFVGYKTEGQTNYDLSPEPTNVLVVEELPAEEVVQETPVQEEKKPDFGESNVSAADQFIQKKREELNIKKETPEVTPVFDTPAAEVKEETPAPPNFMDEEDQTPDAKFD